MMLHNAFRPLWELLAQLLGEFGWISKVGVVDVDVLRNDGLDASANTIAVSRFSTQIGRSNS
jgi:hypothetical protein